MRLSVRPEPGSRRELLSYGLGAALVVVAGYLVILLRNPRFFYQDDTEGGAVPDWLMFGRLLRQGHVPVLSPDAWMTGNWTVEGQGGVWNPASVVIDLIAPSVDRLDLLAAGVKCVFAVILATGVYRVALHYGARPWWAAAAGAAMPFAGFVLYYDSASWVTGLICSAWVAQAWASGLRYLRGRSGPIPVFVFLYLALSVGYVHGAIAAGAVAACLMVGESAARVPRTRVIRFALVAVAAAMCGAVTFLPGYLSSAVTWRTSSGPLATNSNFLTAPWSETFDAALPIALPAIQGFAGEVQRSPITYIAWFLVPALAFIRFDRLRPLLRELLTPLVFLALMLFVTAGPSQLGPLRWPARMLPYVAMPVLVLAAVVLSRAADLSRPRRWVSATVVLAVLGLVRAGSASPALGRRYLVWTAAIVALSLGMGWLWSRRGPRWAAALVMLSTLPVLFFEVAQFPTNPNVLEWNYPSSQSAAAEAFHGSTGLTLQFGNLYLQPQADRTVDNIWGSLVFGNYSRLVGQDYVNAYTPVGHAQFAQMLCMNYMGATCPAAYRAVFTKEPTTGKPYVDLMGVDRVVVQKAQHPELAAAPAPAGWTWTAPTTAARVLERVTPLDHRGARVTSHAGVTIAPGSTSSDTSEHLVVSSESGGRLVFSRLSWPGYSATLDGRELPVSSVHGVFLSVDIPAHTRSSELALTFVPPGWRFGTVLAVLGVLLLLAIIVLDHRTWRPRLRARPARDVSPAPHP